MSPENFKRLFPKTSKHTKNCFSLRHERVISRGVAQHIRLHITDAEAETMTFMQIIKTAKARSGFTGSGVRFYGTYDYADSLLEPQITAARLEDSWARAAAGEAYDALVAYREARP